MMAVALQRTVQDPAGVLERGEISCGVFRVQGAGYSSTFMPGAAGRSSTAADSTAAGWWRPGRTSSGLRATRPRA